MNSDFDTDAAWVVTCPGPGAPHPLAIPKSLGGANRIMCRCGQTFGAADCHELVRKRDVEEKRDRV